MSLIPFSIIQGQFKVENVSKFPQLSLACWCISAGPTLSFKNNAKQTNKQTKKNLNDLGTA